MSIRYSQIKRKFHSKVLSDDAVYVNWVRCIDVSSLFREYVWMDIPVFDLTLLGLGLTLSILPIEFKPFTIDFEVLLPDLNEVLQGIIIKFKPVRYEVKYDYLVDWEKLAKAIIKPEYREDIIRLQYVKGRYDVTTYGLSLFDPIIARKFISETFNRLRLERKVQVSFQYILEKIATHVGISDFIIEDAIYRFMLICSAQVDSLLLGVSLLGKSRLSKRNGDFAVINLDGLEVKYRTLDHLQMGFILGVTRLGYGLLLPRDGIYRFDAETKSVPAIKPTIEKIIGILNRLSYTAYAYSNYNKPDEMVNPHTSERTTQYDYLQEYRRRIEDWTLSQIKPEDVNPVKARQYQNAVLQAVSWRAKRHAWGYEPFKLLSEEEFEKWWIDYWAGQGLNRDTLTKLYENMKVWVEALRNMKINVGRGVSERRFKLAGSVKP